MSKVTGFTVFRFACLASRGGSRISNEERGGGVRLSNVTQNLLKFPMKMK